MNRRCLLVATVTTVATVAGLGLGLRRLGDPRAATDAAGAVTWLAGAALLGCLLWLGLAVVATAVDAGRAPRHPAARAHRARPALPAPLRRLVLLACGAAVVGGLALPAQAVPDPAVRPSATAVLDGLPLPHLPATGSPAATTRVTTGPARPQPAVHVVTVGESLWSITADLLGPGADAAAIAGAWPLLHRANRAALGPDADLLLPGQRLLVPPSLRPALPRTAPAARTERPSR